MSQVLLYAILFLVALTVSSFVNFIDRGVTRGRNVSLQRELVGSIDKKYYDTENQMRQYQWLLEELNNMVPPQYKIKGAEEDQVRLLQEYGKPYSFRKAKLRTYFNIPYGYPFEILQKPRLENMNETMFLTLMLSQGCSFSLRSMVREKTQMMRRKFGVYSIFVLANPMPSCNDQIAKENEEFGDILQFDHRDSYNNITLSVLFAFHYIHALRLPVKYIFKTDSDCVINYPRLNNMISRLSREEKANLYMGLCDQGKSYNTMDASRKNYIPASLVKNETYISYYVTGGGYVISYSLLPRLLAGLSHLPFIGHNEDVNVGRGMKLVNIRCHDVRPKWIARHGCISKEECLEYVVIHPWLDESEVPKYYSYLVE